KRAADALLARRGSAVDHEWEAYAGDDAPPGNSVTWVHQSSIRTGGVAAIVIAHDNDIGRCHDERVGLEISRNCAPAIKRGVNGSIRMRGGPCLRPILTRGGPLFDTDALEDWSRRRSIERLIDRGSLAPGRCKIVAADVDAILAGHRRCKSERLISARPRLQHRHCGRRGEVACTKEFHFARAGPQDAAIQPAGIGIKTGCDVACTEARSRCAGYDG